MEKVINNVTGKAKTKQSLVTQIKFNKHLNFAKERRIESITIRTSATRQMFEA